MKADFFWRTAGGGRECEFRCDVPETATVAEMLAIAGALAPVNLHQRTGRAGVYQIQTDLGIYNAPSVGTDVRSPRTTFKTWEQLDEEN